MHILLNSYIHTLVTTWRTLQIRLNQEKINFGTRRWNLETIEDETWKLEDETWKLEDETGKL